MTERGFKVTQRGRGKVVQKGLDAQGRPPGNQVLFWDTMEPQGRCIFEGRGDRCKEAAVSFVGCLGLGREHLGCSLLLSPEQDSVVSCLGAPLDSPIYAGCVTLGKLLHLSEAAGVTGPRTGGAERRRGEREVFSSTPGNRSRKLRACAGSS